MDKLGHVGAQPIPGTAFLPSLAPRGRPGLVPESGCCRAPGVPLPGPEPWLPGSQGAPPSLPSPASTGLLLHQTFTKPGSSGPSPPTLHEWGRHQGVVSPWRGPKTQAWGCKSEEKVQLPALSLAACMSLGPTLSPSLSFLNLSAVVQSLRRI